MKPVWFSFKRRNSSEKVFNLLFNTDVNNFPKQLKMVIHKINSRYVLSIIRRSI
jgi:hypothetical protein